MHIVQVASEVTPVAKVGGLADVIMGLGRALKHEHRVDIVVPKYDCLETKDLVFAPSLQDFTSEFQGEVHLNSVVKASLDGSLELTFIQAHHPRAFFDRGLIYGCADDIDR